MEIKEIQVGFTYTKNLGNFESLKVDAGARITVEPGQDIDQLYSKAYREMKQQIKFGLNEFGKGVF
ncbi:MULTISPECIES: hypothetical protein [unclassified Sporosarcina]|uniref:hypothetical protein n=1 Tax=unclassified Sporosarcina TaxID=2647733 RepID=UPI00203E803E|nr:MULTISPECIES: hypothetical protein [unclassified Sporosarcina]GKV66724.1 hypothetical protein NCCP2331_28770 [Sporosarcina sp. NCCP-2331]GLB57093.1 hypothetical protein NCCP2378_28800 [Sporosarcina sp. NCCP-2378]